MPRIPRRTFLKTSALAASALTLRPLRAAEANSAVRVAVVGLNGRGYELVKDVMRTPAAKLAVLCDADTAVLEAAAAKAEKEFGVRPELVQNFRKVLDRKDIDAVILCTPNHLHALQTIWACQAGKDVYVEKPVCHDVWEGRQMVAAARKYGRIVQPGFQNRSDQGLRAAMPDIVAGKFGKVSLIRGLCYRNRASIGKQAAALVPPATLDYAEWLGPAADLPIYRPRLHYDWHWVWNTGNGDIGNQGPHELDLIRWALGDPEHPRRVVSFGGRFAWNDAGETPNMQVAVFDWGTIPVVFEVRNLWVNPTVNAAPVYHERRVGIIIQTEAGEIRANRGGAALFAADSKAPVQRWDGDGGGDHFPGFIKAVQSRKESDLFCTLETGHRSSSLAHLANISYQSGSSQEMEKMEAMVQKNDLLGEIYERFQMQLQDWAVDFKAEKWRMGQELYFIAGKERFSGDGAKEANALLRRKARQGWEIPKMV